MVMTLGVAACASANAETYYVAPHGDDSWSGRLPKPNRMRSDGPLASLAGARDAIRGLKAHGPLTGPVRVIVAAGNYALPEPVVFTPEDSGTAACPITYEAAPSARPVFSGGRAITGFHAAENGAWTTRISDVEAGRWYFEQLFVNGRRAARTRSPRRFWNYMQSPLGYGPDPATGQATNLGARAIIAQPEDLQPLSRLSPAQLHDVTLVAYSSWAVSLHHIASVDPQTNMIYLTGPAVWPFYQWTPHPRFHLENVAAVVDEPGEWRLERDGLFSYKPLPGEDPVKSTAIAPMLDTFVRFAGDAAKDRIVEHITLQGLVFEHGQFLLPPLGHADGQAAMDDLPAAITADGARDITVRSCEIAHIGSYGVWFRSGCRDCRVEHCHLYDLGEGGIRIGASAIPKDVEDHTGAITIDNNIIHAAGRIDPGAVGVWIGQSGGNTVSHNEIADLYYTGISVGWTWGYGPSLARDNHIDFNHIHHIGQGVLNDMGGIYTLGQSPGGTIQGNVIHDIRTRQWTGAGIYNDEGTSGITVSDNLVYNTSSGGYCLHYGENNVVRNNIFAFGGSSQILVANGDNPPPDPDANAFIFEKNIVYWTEGDVLSPEWPKDPRAVMANNLYHALSGQVTFRGKSFAEWQQSGHDAGSLVADPKFLRGNKFDFRLHADSPANKIGFRPFDPDKAGVYGDRDWRGLARETPVPTLDTAPDTPPSPPLKIDDTFEYAPLGARPAIAQVQMGAKENELGVTDESAASGARSLKVSHGADPHAVGGPTFLYKPNHTEGVSRLAFDLRIETGAKLYIEWRDDAIPSAVGPNIGVANDHLQVGGKDMAALPIGLWAHVEIVCGLGGQSTGTWDLTVALPGQAPRKFPGLHYGRGDFKALKRLTFMSTSQDKTVFYLDNLELTNGIPPT